MLVRSILRRPTYVNVDVQTSQMPPPENQYIDGKKWPWAITIRFHRQLPSIGKRADNLNELLLMVEGNRLMVGQTFVAIYTEKPDKYDARDLASAVSRCFGLTLVEARVIKSRFDVCP